MLLTLEIMFTCFLEIISDMRNGGPLSCWALSFGLNLYIPWRPLGISNNVNSIWEQYKLIIIMLIVEEC